MLEPSPRKFPNRKRPRREPTPRFKADEGNQLDFARGCAAAQLPKKHLAREVAGLVEKLDLRAVEAKYSSLGRRGYHPRHMVGVLVYGSLVGLHHSTKLGVALKTDAALRFVAGGHAISAGRLRAFRRENAELFVAANEQVLALAKEAGLLKPQELATDSVRLRAHASTKSARTLKRSKQRLEELAKVDLASLDEAQREVHAEKKAKHEAAVSECERTGRTNLVLSSPTAGLLKFPNGASGPGHRVTVTGAGVRERLIVDVLIDADAHDFGKLGGAMERTRALLQRLGVSLDRMQVAADAGYCSEEDLRFAADNREWVDVLIAERPITYRGNDGETRLFPPSEFQLREDGRAVCPAGTQMEGPYKDGRAIRFEGIGCEACPLKPRCTKGKRKYLTVDPESLRLRRLMRDRMSTPGGTERYHQRIATIEPVFSSLQDSMGFRRVSARQDKSIRAEIMLKVLSYNLSRLTAARRRLRRVRLSLSWAV